MRKVLLLLLMSGCSMHMHRTAIKGTVDVIEDDWCAVEVDAESANSMWININSKRMKNVKEGDKVVFYVKVKGETK